MQKALMKEEVTLEEVLRMVGLTPILVLLKFPKSRKSVRFASYIQVSVISVAVKGNIYLLSVLDTM